MIGSILIGFIIAVPAIYILEGGKFSVSKKQNKNKHEDDEIYDDEFIKSVREKIDSDIRDANLRVFNSPEFKTRI